MYDFYSDTKSIPTNAMLESIVSAPLGHGQKGEDPTTPNLEARIAKCGTLRQDLSSYPNVTDKNY